MRLQPKWAQVSACATRPRNNRNHRVAPAALQIRATLNEDLRLFKPPHERATEMNNADNIQLFKTIGCQESEKTKPKCSGHDTSK